MKHYTNQVLDESDIYDLDIPEQYKDVLFYVLSCGHVHCDDSTHCNLRYCSNYMLICVNYGELVIDHHDSCITCEKGQIAFIDCALSYKYKSVGESEFSFIVFNGFCADKLYCRIIENFDKQYVFRSANYQDINHALDDIIFHCCDGSEVRYAQHSSLIYNALCLMLNDKTQKITFKEDSSQMGKAMSFIKKNLSNQLSLREISERAGISPFHFSRLFKKYTGCSPHEYVINSRLNRAKLLLKTTDLTIKSIAFSIGYKSESNFINSFTSKIGVPPGKYRNNN